MDNKQLRKLNRKQLLEIMLVQVKRIEELENKIENMEEQLNSRKILIEDTGNLADATLKLNGLFEIAQKTADEYVLNVQENCKLLEEKIKKECEDEKNKILKETEILCKKKIQEANKKIREKNKKSVNNQKNISKKNSDVKTDVIVTVKKPRKRNNKK